MHAVGESQCTFAEVEYKFGVRSHSLAVQIISVFNNSHFLFLILYVLGSGINV